MSDIAIRRVFRVVNGGTPTSVEENWNGEVLWATPIDLAAVDGASITSTARMLTRVGVDSGSATVPKGSLVLSTRAPIGYVAGTTAETAFNQGCRGLVPRVELDLRFFRYQFLGRRADLVSRGQGSTFTELSSESLATFKVRCPPLTEQRQIADFLDAETARIDALIEKKRRMIALTTESFRAYLDSAFSREAPRVRLGRFVTLLGQGTSPEAETREADRDEWAVLKLSAVRFGRYRPSENKALPADYRADASLVPRSGDLLVTRSNTPEYVGDACAVAEDVPYRMLCDLIYMIRLDRRLDPEYAAYALLTSDARWQVQSAARGSSQSMVKLRGEDIKAVEIPYVSLLVQQTIVDKIEDRRSRTDELVVATESQISLLREHRQALITAAVTGRLDVAMAAA